MNNRIGFMQGRLSPMLDGRIQAFPWPFWQSEFPRAQALGLHLMEWTLDQDRLYANPIMTTEGQHEIVDLCAKHSLAIPSLTGDCFMQAPFWKAKNEECRSLQNDFLAVTSSCMRLQIHVIVVPLVDRGCLENCDQEDSLVDFLNGQSAFLAQCNVQIAFESDYAPDNLARFIDRFAPAVFGINYDTGNSAALGFDPGLEMAAYGNRIRNVHIKDRILGGTTVPLGTGYADFEKVFAALASVGYQGNYILQTARSAAGEHAAILSQYRDMTADWIARYAA